MKETGEHNRSSKLAEYMAKTPHSGRTLARWAKAARMQRTKSTQTLLSRLINKKLESAITRSDSLTNRHTDI